MKYIFLLAFIQLVLQSYAQDTSESKLSNENMIANQQGGKETKYFEFIFTESSSRAFKSLCNKLKFHDDRVISLKLNTQENSVKIHLKKDSSLREIVKVIDKHGVKIKELKYLSVLNKNVDLKK